MYGWRVGYQVKNTVHVELPARQDFFLLGLPILSPPNHPPIWILPASRTSVYLSWQRLMRLVTPDLFLSSTGRALGTSYQGAETALAVGEELTGRCTWDRQGGR